MAAVTRREVAMAGQIIESVTRDEPLDQLYRLPLEEFTAARNALAKQLRAAGDQPVCAAAPARRPPVRASGGGPDRPAPPARGPFEDLRARPAGAVGPAPHLARQAFQAAPEPTSLAAEAEGAAAEAATL